MQVQWLLLRVHCVSRRTGWRFCHCKGGHQNTQLTLGKIMRQTPRNSKLDAAAMKWKEILFCTVDCHWSVENSGFKNTLQTCVDMGAKYGKFNVGETLTRRKAVARGNTDSGATNQGSD